MSAFVISKRFNGEFKFVFTSRKGKTILTSFGYLTKEVCENAITNTKLNLEHSTYQKCKTTGGKYFFKLVLNEKIRAVSRKYSTELMLQKGINEFVTYGYKSEILDFSSDAFIFLDAAVTNHKL